MYNRLYLMEILKVLLKAGSSQHGNISLAPIGRKRVALTHLPVLIALDEDNDALSIS